MSKSLFSLGVLAGSAALALTTAAPAQALSFNLVRGVPYLGDSTSGAVTSRPPAGVFDFNSLSTGLYTGETKNGITLTPTGDVQVYKGSILPNSSNNNYAPPYCSGTSVPCSDPAGQSSNTSGYLSIGEGGTLTATFSKAARYIGFAWGYADATDSVVVNWLDSFGLAQTDTYTDAIFGNQEDSAYVNLLAGSGEKITSVIWSKSGDGRFEIDNIAVVPTPALLPGLIGMGVAALRKRKQVDEAQEA